MKTIHIIVRHFTPNSGSYAGMVEQFSKYAQKKGYKIKILCVRKKDNLKAKEKLPYAEIIRFDIPDLSIPLFGMNFDYMMLAKNVRKYFKKNKTRKDDIFIANGRAALGISDKKYVLRMGQPALTFLRNMDIAKEEVSIITRIARSLHFHFQYLLEKKVVSNADKIISSSVESRNHVSRYYGGKQDFFIPHSGVKYDDLQSKTKKGKLNLLFVAVGKEKIRKGVIYLERALPKIFRKYKDVELIHVGDKFEWTVPEKYKNKIKQVGRVPWNDMKKYYNKNHVLVNCALNEWIPNIIFEAMAAGSPIVTSDLDGMHETLMHKKEAYIYRRGDVKGLIKAISYMLDNPEKSRNMAKRAKEKVKSIEYGNFSQNLLDFIHGDYTINLLNSSELK